MSATATENGKNVDLEAARKVVAADNAAKRAKAPKRALPNLPSEQDYEEVATNLRVSKVPTDFKMLPNHTAFSLSNKVSGFQLLIKTSASRYVDTRTNQSFPCGGGTCYRVIV